jgi:1,4-alpha-glucan branching enzyme
VKYGGSGQILPDEVVAEEEPWHGLPASAAVTLPPLGAFILAPD